METFSLDRARQKRSLSVRLEWWAMGLACGLTQISWQNTSTDERRKLISSLRKIAKADDSVDQYEILEIQNISEMLGL